MLRRILYTFIFVMFISFAVSAQGKIERPSSSSKSAKTTGTLNGHNYVDLGLPSGTKWATCNIGTDKFDYYGDYFVWGNPRVITNDNVSWNLRPQYYGQSSFSGLAEYDPARALWRGRWQTPSKEAFEELMEYCTFTWTDEYDGGVWAQSKRNGEKYISLRVEVALGLRGMTTQELSDCIGHLFRHLQNQPMGTKLPTLRFVFNSPNLIQVYAKSVPSQDKPV